MLFGWQLLTSSRTCFGNPQGIHACLVCDLHVANLPISDFSDEVLKQVTHDMVDTLQKKRQALTYRFISNYLNSNF